MGCPVLQTCTGSSAKCPRRWSVSRAWEAQPLKREGALRGRLARLSCARRCCGAGAELEPATPERPCARPPA
eukprot:6863125-Pyramimonas_sp.AAC.1